MTFFDYYHEYDLGQPLADFGSESRRGTQAQIGWRRLKLFKAWTSSHSGHQKSSDSSYQVQTIGLELFNTSNQSLKWLEFSVIRRSGAQASWPEIITCYESKISVSDWALIVSGRLICQPAWCSLWRSRGISNGEICPHLQTSNCGPHLRIAAIPSPNCERSLV